MAIWTHKWSNSDDGSVLHGDDLGQIQTDIENYFIALLRGSFTNSDLSSGVLTIIHNGALAAPYTLKVVIFDNNNQEIVPDAVTGTANNVSVDLSSYGTISGTWGYLVMK